VTTKRGSLAARVAASDLKPSATEAHLDLSQVGELPHGEALNGPGPSRRLIHLNQGSVPVHGNHPTDDGRIAP
jgi:hypothetical protein